MTFTPIPAGTRNWDVLLNAALQDLQDQIESYTLFGAPDHNLLAWTMDPALTQGGTILTAGVLYMARIKLPEDSTVTNLITSVTTGGSTLTAGQNFGALYTSTGTLVAITADQSASWTGAGAKTMALTGGPYALTAGTYYAALLANGSTPPTFLRGHGVSTSTLNIGLTAATGGRSLTSGVGQTTPPASVTLASASLDFKAWWFALS
jgi:hypothetical protein